MPSNKTSTNPSGQTITFNERWHKYKSQMPDGKTIEYKSVTTLIHDFSQPFDAPAQAARVAERDGVKVEDVLKEWEDKRNYASDFGTRIHETCEDILLGNKRRNTMWSDDERPVAEHAYEVASRIKGNMKVLDVEKIVFDVEDEIAGTIDLFAEDKKGQIWIMDWKTNASIDKFNKFRKVMLPPVNNLSDCNFNHYSLQLSMYEHILKKVGYIDGGKTVKRALIHLTKDGFEFMHTPDYSDYVSVILECYKRKIEEDREIPF